MFIYPDTSVGALSKFRQGLKFDKKYKNKMYDPNAGLDYVSSVNYVQPIFKEKFQSDKFVKDLLQKCKNINKKSFQVIKDNNNKISTKNINNSLKINKISSNNQSAQGIFKLKPKIRNRIISRAKTEAISYGNDLVQEQTKKSKIPNEKIFKDKLVNDNITFQKYHAENRSALSSKKVEIDQDQQSVKDSEGSEQNDNIFLKSTFLKSKQFKRNKKMFQSNKNTFNEKISTNDIKTAYFSSRHKFKPHKTQFSNDVTFIKRKSDYVKLNPQNINQFVEQVIENYGNKFRGRVSTEASPKVFQFKGYSEHFNAQNQRILRNKTEIISSQNRWSRNSMAKSFYPSKKIKNQLTSVSFYPQRSKTYDNSLANSKQILNINNQIQQMINNKSSLKTID